MAITLNATPGDRAANSYETIAAATSYFEGRASSNKWDDLTDDQKARHLVTATRQIDAVIRGKLSPLLTIAGFNYAQALVWPWDDGGFYHKGYVDSGLVTTVVDAELYSGNYPNDYWNDGSILIYETTDRKAPEGEIKDISDYTRDVDNATATITLAALSTAPGEGDYYIAIMPPPSWLTEATCEQAWFVAMDKAGIVEKAAMGMESYTDGKKNFNISRYSVWSRLCHETQILLRPFIPAPATVRV